MSVLKKSVLGIMTIILLILGLTKYNDHKENNALKKALDNHDYIPALHYLLKSDRYADEIQKAGVSIVRDKTMAFEKGINAIKIKGEIDFELDYPGDSDTDNVTIYFQKSINGNQISALWTLDRHLNIIDSGYYRKTSQGINEEVTISKSEEDQLLHLARKEIQRFLDKMANMIHEKR